MAKKRWPEAVARFDDHWGTLDWSRHSPSRLAVLEAFLRLATEHGFVSVSMRMMAKELNIKPASLYSHFAGRDEIVAESLRWHFSKFGNAVLEEIREVADPTEGWRRMIRVHLTRQIELPESNLWDLLVATDQVVHYLPPDLRSEVDAWVDLYEGLYRAAAFDMGHGKRDEQVKLIMTILEGANRWYTSDGNQRRLAAAVERATNASFALLQL